MLNDEAKDQAQKKVEAQEEAVNYGEGERYQYDKSDGTIRHINEDGTVGDFEVGARSGKPGRTEDQSRGPTPVGTYKLTDMVKNNTISDPDFGDKSGNKWFQRMEPEFTTDRGKTTKFGIHPDGFGDSTKGCVGLTQVNTIKVYQHIIQNNHLKLEVVY